MENTCIETTSVTRHPRLKVGRVFPIQIIEESNASDLITDNQFPLYQVGSNSLLCKSKKKHWLLSTLVKIGSRPQPVVK